MKNESGIIYLASPYSDYSADKEKVMALRFHLTVIAAGEIIAEGYMVYSPIVHNHPIAVNMKMPTGWVFWKNHDVEMLKVSSVMYILQLPGWENSFGIQEEMEIAKGLGIPIAYKAVSEEWVQENTKTITEREEL